MTSVVRLDRAHHLERLFLCVGQALDAGDVAPLIGTIAAQRLHVLAALHLPDLDGSIIAAASEEATVGTGAQGLYRSFVPLSRQAALPVLRIPPAESAITARADQAFAVRAPGNAKDQFVGVIKRANPLPALGIPNQQLIAAMSPAA